MILLLFSLWLLELGILPGLILILGSMVELYLEACYVLPIIDERFGGHRL